MVSLVDYNNIIPQYDLPIISFTYCIYYYLVAQPGHVNWY